MQTSTILSLAMYSLLINKGNLYKKSYVKAAAYSVVMFLMLCYVMLYIAFFFQGLT